MLCSCAAQSHESTRDITTDREIAFKSPTPRIPELGFSPSRMVLNSNLTFWEILVEIPQLLSSKLVKDPWIPAEMKTLIYTYMLYLHIHIITQNYFDIFHPSEQDRPEYAFCTALSSIESGGSTWKIKFFLLLMSWLIKNVLLLTRSGCRSCSLTKFKADLWGFLSFNDGS